MISFVIENTWTSRVYGLASGWGNGYVAIPKGHPAYEKNYDKIVVEIHGGLTFSEHSDNLNYPHLPKFDEKYWIVGFDTAHYGDTPKSWTRERVLEETERLKTQLSNMIEDEEINIKKDIDKLVDKYCRPNFDDHEELCEIIGNNVTNYMINEINRIAKGYFCVIEMAR